MGDSMSGMRPDYRKIRRLEVELFGEAFTPMPSMWELTDEPGRVIAYRGDPPQSLTNADTVLRELYGRA